MSSPDLAAASAHEAAERRALYAASVRRSRAVARLRVALPALMALLLLAVIGSVFVSSRSNQPSRPAATKAPIQLTAPRLTGTDDKGRPFIITAASAVRDPDAYERVVLKEPILSVDENGPNRLRITGHDGLYDEGTRKLSVSGGVLVTSPRGTVETPASVFDTKTGEIVGTSGIRTAVGGTTTSARSFAVTDKGGQVVYKGGVRSRINVK